MADSPPRSGTSDSASGDDLDAAQVIEDGSGPEPAPSPFGGARPWWSVDIGDGTGPHAMVNGTGPQAMPRNGTGPHAMPVSANGSGALPVVGTGPHGVIRGGTGPLPQVTGAPPGAGGRMPKLLLAAGAVVAAGLLLVAGMLALRTGGVVK
ncbi:MAG: hypothetical protein HOU01_05820, partial [Streptomycetaceae bacterium]|nr:hypothetical protein [Streptomycetaceae bacterium]